MKTQHSFLASLFGAGKSSNPTRQNKPRPVSITAYSQSNILQQRMKEKNLTHGETVSANLSTVRLEKNFGQVIMYFCPMKNIEVMKTINVGDGGRIPEEAKVESLIVPSNLKAGFYTLKNITLTSNGTIQVIATSETIWELEKAQTGS